MNDDYSLDDIETEQRVEFTNRMFLGLTPNLWRLAVVLAVAQFSIGLWKWQYGIYLETIIEPWQMGLTFSVGMFAALFGNFFSGTIADFIGRKRTLASAFIPITIGLITLSIFPVWPLIPLQWGLIWYGANNIRIMSRAIPADEIAADAGRKPARKLMMVMMPMWFVDGVSPLLGAFLLSIGFRPADLHQIAAVGAMVAFVVTIFVVKESLASEIIQKAKAGPKLSFRDLGGNFWKLAVGMVTFIFFYSSAIQYLGNLSVDEWAIDTVTYGLTWSAFSLTSAIMMYPLSLLADKNLKASLVAAVAGQGIAFLSFGLGSGVVLMYLINIFWAMPFMIWIGSERGLVILSVSEEIKGRALGVYGLLMGITSAIAASFGAILWEISGSLRVVWIVSGIGMFVSLFILVLALRSMSSVSTG
jgi:MFS family permease